MTIRTFLFAGVTAAVLATAAEKSNLSEIDAVLRSAVARKAVPGVVAIVANAGGVVYSHATGYDANAIFSIASMTKPVTSVAIMQLVEAGKVKLDSPASTYAPDLARVQVLDSGVLRTRKSPITVRQLLTHTSGFAYEFMNRDLAGQVASGKVASAMAGGDAFLKAPLMFDPGTRWEYGISTDWLGRIVELVSGKTLEQYFREHIFEPLAMKDSFFRVPADKRSRVAASYQRQADGTLLKKPAMTAPDSDFFSGGGGLSSTASDYITFVRALLGGGQLGGKRILKTETVALMGRNHIGDLSVRPLPSLAPQFSTDMAELPGNLDKFGLGFALNSRAVEGGRGPNTMAWAGIFNTFFWIDREKKIGAVLLMQASPFLDGDIRKVLDDFERAVYRSIK